MEINPISSIKASNINTEIKMRGVRISNVTKNKFRLQEYDSNSNDLPKCILCSYDKLVDIEINIEDYVEVDGIVKFNQQLKEIYVEVKSVDIITKEEADIHLISKINSFFNPNNLQILIDDTMSGIIEILSKKACEEGFNLVRKRSIKEERLTLFCNQHTNYKKNDLNSKCEYKIRIGSYIIDNKRKYHVTYFDLHHNHYLNSFIYAHLVLDDKIQISICNMLDIGIKPNKVIQFISIQYGVTLSREQINSIYSKNEKLKCHNKYSETHKLIDYLDPIKKQTFVLQNVDDENIIHREAVATFTKYEL